MRNILSRTLALLFSVTAITCAVSCEPEENKETPSGLEALFTDFEKTGLIILRGR